MTYNNTIRLSNIVEPTFAKPHAALKQGGVNQLVLRGGRGSGKSSYASIEGILTIVGNRDTHGVVLRKVSNTLRSIVFTQYQWAVSELGLFGKFRRTVSPMELTYIPTGQKIMFFGADDHGKLKSNKPSFGYSQGYLKY
ncbi:hypothetical protein AGMMS49975_27880 [Clostridia bacterium]|nr:hypothetical protein AGMMS49975_27880 [Clostridia bacterium]